MHTNEPRELQGVELGYDPRDIDSRGIYKIVIGFFLFTLAFFGIGAAFFAWKGWGGKTSFDPRKPAIVGPKVQGNIDAKVDIMEMRQHERALMSTYEENKNGSWRIPVDRAMDLVAKEGLPKISSDKTAVSEGNTIPQNATGPTPSSTSTSPSMSSPTEHATGGEPEVSDLPHRDPGMSAPTPTQP